MIFVEPSTWFALLYDKAAERPGATWRFAEIESGRYGAPVTTDCVLDETFTLLRHRVGVDSVARRSSLLRESPSIRRLRVSDVVFDGSLKPMLSRPDKRWSFTDGTSFVTMRETRIAKAFTWDHNFTEAGFDVLPESRTATSGRR